MPVGERLRRARLERGLSLEQVSKHTKVQPWILDAIERDDLSRIPGGVFIRGYLTSFARAIGLDPIDIVTAHFGAPPAPADPEPPPPVVEPPRPTGTPLWQMAVIVAAVITVGVLWRGAARRDAHPVAASKPASAASSRTSEQPEPSQNRVAAPTATTGVVAAAAPIDTQHLSETKPISAGNAPLVVELHATGEAWIEATVDGERKAYRLFNQGETLRLDGQKEVRLLVGDAGAVTYTVNGKPAPPLGGPGIVRSVVISGDSSGIPVTSHPVADDATHDGGHPAAGLTPPPSTVASGAISEPTPDVRDQNGKETPASDAGAPTPDR